MSGTKLSLYGFDICSKLVPRAHKYNHVDHYLFLGTLASSYKYVMLTCMGFLRMSRCECNTYCISCFSNPANSCTIRTEPSQMTIHGTHDKIHPA